MSEEKKGRKGKMKDGEGWRRMGRRRGVEG